MVLKGVKVLKKQYSPPFLQLSEIEDILYSSDENIGDGSDFGDWEEDVPDNDFNFEESFEF